MCSSSLCEVVRYVLRVVRSRLRGETELGADERRRHLGDLLGRMSVRAEAVAELAIEPVARARIVTELTLSPSIDFPVEPVM